MNWIEIHEKWEGLRPLLLSYWTRLSEEDLKRIQGDRQALATVLQERYGYAAGEAEQEIARFEHNVRFPGAVK
jgi:hypothetical protein